MAPSNYEHICTWASGEVCCIIMVNILWIDFYADGGERKIQA